MTVDEALAYGISGGATVDPKTTRDRERCDVECMIALAAEVKRLRRVEAGVFSKDAQDWKNRAETLRAELQEVTHAVEDGILGGVLIYRIAGSELKREPVAELLREFNRLREVVAAQAETIRKMGIDHAEQSATQRLALDVATREVERLRTLVAEGDFKDIYCEGIEIGRRLGPTPT